MAPLFWRSVAFCIATSAAQTALAAPPEFAFPAPARISAQTDDPLATARFATGPFADGTVPAIEATGALSQRAWMIPASSLGTLQLLTPLREQLESAGFTPIYTCETQGCGGFDFRFGIPVLAEPDMHIDLGDFRYLSAQRATPSGTEYAALIVSRSSDTGFVQLNFLSAAKTGTSPQTTATPPANPQAAPAQTTQSADPSLTAPLDQGLPVVLENLVFASGSSTLETGDYPALRALADWLAAHPKTVVTLVGHTDTDGGLAGNITVSRARAAAVRSYLVQSLNVPPAQLLAEGAGYLAPRATNQTPEGRQKNRRVEVIITSTP